MDKVKSKALTFDDVLYHLGIATLFLVRHQHETRLTRNISIKMPLISAAMDTVTESRMAIALAEAGGIGIIHKNNSIEEQVFQLKALRNMKVEL